MSAGSLPGSRPANGWRWGAAAIVLAAVLAGCGGGGRGARRAAPGPTVAERRAIHDGLERIGRACPRKGARPDADRVASREVQRLIAFRRRYPTQRFAVERGGETATMVAVLLVARSQLVGCSAGAVESIDRFLPPRVREALPPARGPGTG